LKQLGNKQWQRKAQSLLALLTYQLARGPVEAEPFVILLQKMFDERIKTDSVSIGVLKNSLAQAKLGKLPKIKKLKRKFAHFLILQQQKGEEREQPTDNSPLTVGQIVTGWAGLTGQDKTEFASKVCTKIKELVINHYKATGQVGLTDSQAYENPETAFDFMTDLLNILIEETPEDKKNSLIKKMKAALITSTTQPAVEVDSELLRSASTMLTTEIAAEISGALTDNPSAKDRIINPVFSELMAMEARKYGWDSGVPVENHAQLQFAISQNGASPSKRMMSRSLRMLGRKNVLQNVNDALDGNLIENLNKIIREQTAIEQSKTRSIWEFSPVSPGDAAETEKRIREWLFRRNNNDTG